MLLPVGLGAAIAGGLGVALLEERFELLLGPKSPSVVEAANALAGGLPEPRAKCQPLDPAAAAFLSRAVHLNSNMQIAQPISRYFYFSQIAQPISGYSYFLLDNPDIAARFYFLQGIGLLSDLKSLNNKFGLKEAPSNGRIT